MAIHLGHRLDDDAAAISLPVQALLRHVMALGSSGSGKTVLCKVIVEEAVRAGLPVICVDPQGDLCSLASSPDDADGELRDREPRDGELVDDEPSDAARAFRERADVVVFTPASRRGLPLCADPLGGALATEDGDGAAPEEQMQARSRAAQMIVALLGYDIDGDDGAGLRAVIDTALADMAEASAPATRLEHLSEHLSGLDDAGLERYARFLDARKIRTACQRLARLDVGARRLLFHDGLPIDIDLLLGRGPRGGALEGKTRVSVIYLNTLHSQEDKDFFVAALADRLYAWMLAHPSAEPQAMLYIDEVAPFVPPVRKPACKPGLQMLFKQARKYGLCCLMATQNPGDVDYKAMAQFGTWAMGRLTTRQDLKKIEPIVKSIAPTESDAILTALPARRPGEFALLSPDHFDAAQTMRTRWLWSVHETYDEARIAAITDARWRQRFPVDAPEPQIVATPKPELDATPEPEPEPEPIAAKPIELIIEPVIEIDPDEPIIELTPKSAPEPAAQPSDESRTAAPEPPPSAEPPDPKAVARANQVRTLATRETMTAKQLAAHAGMSVRRAQAALKDLYDRGLARRFKQGNTQHYFAAHTGARPDLGLGRTVAAIVPSIDEARAHAAAEELRRSKLLGLLGEDETFDDAELIYRAVYQVEFEETVERSGLARLVGPRRELLVGTTYHHVRSLATLRFTQKRGVEFVDEPDDRASQIDDFDGVARFDDVALGAIEFDADAWERRRDEAEVRRYFRDRFAATPGKIAPMFVPLWRIRFHQGERGNYRVLWLDALVGRPVEWP